MSLLTRAQQSIFTFKSNGDLEVTNAVIIWKNFEGRENPFGSKKKTFGLVLDEEIGNKLKEEGWNVRFKEGKEPGDDPTITTEIVVNMEHENPKNDPVIELYSSFGGRRSRRTLDRFDVADLDQLELERVDLVIHPYEHNRGGYIYKGYLNELKAVQAEDRRFGGFYSDFMREDIQEEYPFN